MLGVIVSIVITLWVVRTTMTQYVPDYFAYGVFPVLAYLAMLTAAIMILKGQDYAPEVLAGGMLLLAIVNIRNAWDLTLSMVRRHAGKRSPS